MVFLKAVGARGEDPQGEGGEDDGSAEHVAAANTQVVGKESVQKDGVNQLQPRNQSMNQRIHGHSGQAPLTRLLSNELS